VLPIRSLRTKLNQSWNKTTPLRVFAIMNRKVQSLIPRLSEKQGEALREKLSDYVATLLEKNAARLSKYEKPPENSGARTE
jgi:hypothetical protein